MSPVCEELLVGPGNEGEEDTLASAQEKPLSSRRALRAFPACRPLPGVWSQGLEASNSSWIDQLLSLWQSWPPVVCVHMFTFLQIEPPRPGHRKADGAGLHSPRSGVTRGWELVLERRQEHRLRHSLWPSRGHEWAANFPGEGDEEHCIRGATASEVRLRGTQGQVTVAPLQEGSFWKELS